MIGIAYVLICFPTLRNIILDLTFIYRKVNFNNCGYTRLRSPLYPLAEIKKILQGDKYNDHMGPVRNRRLKYSTTIHRCTLPRISTILTRWITSRQIVGIQDGNHFPDFSFNPFATPFIWNQSLGKT